MLAAKQQRVEAEEPVEMQNRKRKDELQPNAATLAQIMDRHSVLLSQLLLRKLSKRLDQSVLSDVEVSQRSCDRAPAMLRLLFCCALLPVRVKISTFWTRSVSS